MNALNVYPVPDGDTGTNMVHTMRSALAYARNAEPTVAAVSAAAAQGALMGARGNSGVILSQIIRGLKDALAGKEEIAGPDLCRAYASAREHAYKAVTQPATGTMLSALAEMADSVGHGIEDPAQVLRTGVQAGVAAVARTQDLNPMNKAAGVVDAGARGLWLLFEGALARLEGRVASAGEVEGAGRLREAGSSTGRTVAAAHPGERPSAGARDRGNVAGAGHDVPADVASWQGAYDVQFLVPFPSRPPEVVKDKMLEFGADCVLVVGDETALKVHVHTLQPDKIIAIGMSVGRITDVVVEDLQAMAAEHERATGIVVPTPRTVIGVVAVLPGDGFVKVARSMGATALRGGATMNPSTQELLDAIQATNAEHVVVLPNDKNVIPAARQAAALADRAVTVVETRTAPQGMCALVAFDSAGAVTDVIAAIERAARDAHGIEVTHAVRDSTVDGQHVRAGEAIAILDGKLVAHGADEAEVLAEAARNLDGPTLLTLYVGSLVGHDRADRAGDALRRACEGADVEVVDGGQPHYPFLVAAE